MYFIGEWMLSVYERKGGLVWNDEVSAYSLVTYHLAGIDRIVNISIDL